MKTSLTERVLGKIVANKESIAEKYMNEYLKYGNVRYVASSKTKPTGFVFYTTKCKTELQKLSREAAKQSIVLVATGNSRLGHVKALITKNNGQSYELVNNCFYHVDEQKGVLSVDGIQTVKGFCGIGVGTAVINFIKDIAISSKCTIVELDSVNSAIPFYKKLGFEVSNGQVCSRGSLTTMQWGVCGELNTTNFTVNELNLMMQRGKECLWK